MFAGETSEFACGCRWVEQALEGFQKGGFGWRWCQRRRWWRRWLGFGIGLRLGDAHRAGFSHDAFAIDHANACATIPALGGYHHGRLELKISALRALDADAMALRLIGHGFWCGSGGASESGVASESGNGTGKRALFWKHCRRGSGLLCRSRSLMRITTSTIDHR